MGAGGAEAVIEELGDEVFVSSRVPEGVDEGRADGWLVSLWKAKWVAEIGVYNAGAAVLFLNWL